MGGTALHAGILALWFEILLVTFLKIRYYGHQWDFIWCNNILCCDYNARAAERKNGITKHLEH